MDRQETLSERLKNAYGVLDATIINELESLIAIRNQVALLIDAASEEGMKSEMFSEAFDTLEVLLYPSRFRPPTTKIT